MSILEKIFGAKTQSMQQVANERLFDAKTAGDVIAALAAGADIEARDYCQQTPLQRAAYYGRNDAIKTLLEAGADVDGRNGRQEVALHSATGWGHSDAVKILLAAGANLGLKDERGRSVIDNARSNYLRQLADYIQSVADGSTPRPTPEDVGLDMDKRNAALAALARGEKPVVGQHTAALDASRERQRQAALDDPTQGI